MGDLTSKTFFWSIIGLIILRILLVILLMHNIPFTDMQLGGFRPNFGGSYWPDEVHYFQLAESFAKFSPVPNVANLGYPLFLAPIIYLTGAMDPVGITKAVFMIQAFLFFSLAIVLVALTSLEIFNNKKLSFLAAGLFTLYPYLIFGVLKAVNFPRTIPVFHYQMWIVIGADYLAAILLYLGFYLFIKKFNENDLNIVWAAAIGVILGGAALVRVANILYLPVIFLILLWIKKYRESIIFGLGAFLIYLPQWIYNFYFFGSPLTYGYSIKQLSGHGSEIKIFGNWFSLGNVFIFFERIWLHLPGLIWILPIICFIFVAGFLKIFNQKKIPAVILGFWAILNIFFYIFFVDAQSQLRYFIPSILPLIILFLAGAIKIYEFRRFL